MADVTQTAGPNETAKELENQRKNSIKAAFSRKKVTEEGEETQGNEQKSQEKPEKSEEKLDIGSENDYINKEEDKSKDSAETSKETADESGDEVDEYQQILNKQFNGDGAKAAKSWKESQKEYTKLRQQLKEREQVLNELDKVVEENPLLEDFIKTARSKGKLTKQDLQNFLQSDEEPTGKPNKSSNESKLGIVDSDFDIDDVDEQTLAEEGLLDLSDKDILSDSEWDFARRRASLKYTMNNAPKRIAQKAYNEFEKQIEDKQKQEEQAKRVKKNKQINSERYQDGIEKVVDKFGLDFAGNEEHRKMLDEIERRASFIRDPENSSVIRPNAIYLATVDLIEEGKLDVDKAPDTNSEAKKAKQRADEELEDKASGFNRSASTPMGDGEPKSIVDKLRQRRLKEYEKEMNWRKQTDRLKKD